MRKLKAVTRCCAQVGKVPYAGGSYPRCTCKMQKIPHWKESDLKGSMEWNSTLKRGNIKCDLTWIGSEWVPERQSPTMHRAVK